MKKGFETCVGDFAVARTFLSESRVLFTNTAFSKLEKNKSHGMQ